MERSSTIQPSHRPFRSCGWSFLLLLLITPSRAQGQDDPYRMLETVKQLEVDSVAGTVPLYFSPSYGERATRLRAMLEEAAAFFRDSLGISVGSNLAVLDEPQWKALDPREGRPYGMPYTSLGKPWLIVLPAIAERSMVYYEHRQHSDESVAKRFVDLIGFHELGHLYTVEYLYPQMAGVHAPIRWFEEMLATYFAYAFLRDRYPEWAAIWDAVIERTVVSADQQPYTSLIDFEERNNDISRTPRGEIPSNYGWYQAAFHGRVRDVFQQQGLTFLVRIKRELSWERLEEWTTEQLLTDLEGIAPGFLAWARQLER